MDEFSDDESGILGSHSETDAFSVGYFVKRSGSRESGEYQVETKEIGLLGRSCPHSSQDDEPAANKMRCPYTFSKQEKAQ